MPERFRAAQESWWRLHPGWAYRLWTDEDLAELVRTRAPELWPLWQAYPDHIQRVDAARYVILREHGGVYADLDLECLRPLDELMGYRVVLPKTTPFGLSNQFMLAAPGEPLFRYAVEALPEAFGRWQRRWLPRHLRVLRTTGPLFITACRRAHGPVGGERILELDEHCHGDPARNWVRNLRGKTWAGWDTHVLNFFHDHWRWLAAGGALAAAALWAARHP